MIEVEFHNNKYKEELKVLDNDLLSNPRLKVLQHFENFTKTKISGKVLDSGCGNGYASIWIAKNTNAEEITSLDISPVAIEHLVPKNIKKYGVNDKVIPTLGDFSNSNLDSNFDFIIAFGSLHHSQCLFSTFRSMAASLKNDGYIIAHEPVMPNYTTHSHYIEKYNEIEKKHGLIFKHGERFDRFYREAEYISAALYCGLDLIHCDEFEVSKASDAVLKSKVFYFKKNKIEYVPHLWKPLKHGD
jgi:SAM-dependent methyltransferase